MRSPSERDHSKEKAWREQTYVVDSVTHLSMSMCIQALDMGLLVMGTERTDSPVVIRPTS
jgi:hypothetical protein